MWKFALHPLEALYLHYHNAFGHQNMQGGDLPLEAPNFKTTSSFNHVVL